MTESPLVPGLHAFVRTPINRADLTDEADKCHGYHASIVEQLAMAERRESETSLTLDQIRDHFAETLVAQQGKVSEAEVSRRIVRLDEWVKVHAEKIQHAANQTLFKGFQRNLEMRHAIVVALINRSNAEIRAQHV